VAVVRACYRRTSRYQLMSDKRYYLCEFRIDGGRLYVVWFTSDKDGLARLSDGKIASSADEHQTRAFCEANAMPLEPDSPAIYDFDEIAVWCSRPAAGKIDPISFLNAWNMLDDALCALSGVRSPYDVTSHRPGANHIYDKLFWANNLPSVTPPGKHYEPIWSPEEIEMMAEIYRLGLIELRVVIQDP
jgi:hypothetical protein